MPKEINAIFLDDEQNILNSIKRQFLSEPYGIAVTSDFKEAISIIEKEKIKVVVSDYRMPEISGVEFLTKVKDQFPDKVRILFTGYADIEAAQDAINVGEVFRFISKPWSEAELRATLKQAMEHYDLIFENQRLFNAAQEKNKELEKLNNELLAMYERYKQFNSTVSHELRTPLASMKMALDIILSRSTGELTKKQEEFLKKAKSNVDRLNRLINDILDLSKMESGKMKVKLTMKDINKIIEEVIDTQRCVAEDKGLYLKTDLDRKLPEIPVDADRINQVVTNLLNNAIKFTNNGGILVTSKNGQKDNTINICVKDSGAGIGREDISKLFSKFVQLADPVKNKTGGTGLGLAICKEIIKNHGGKIWVESKLGEGSCFYFNLPIKERRSL